ncbi:MAG: DNA polymerase III subunit alpha, partial [Nitrosomonas sp.]|nr:DNA polymerase III subunit alpha [Nitrosomonas sp.]
YTPDTEAAKTVAGMKKQLPKAITERAEYELGVIDRMGFNGYFLIVQDFINWGKDNGIVFGPGRGSGAGSIVAYSLRITELDPLTYDLLFERFLNPDRISMPDFDIDIQDTRRDEVIQYCVEKYGHDRVANIVTFGRMQARNAVRDVARVLQVSYADADRLAKMIPQPIQGRHVPLEKSLVENSDLKMEYENNEVSKKVLDQAIRLEGTIRSHGVHAAGVVIAPDDIVKFVPLEMAQKGVVTTQYPMGPIEDLGLLKMDFLGLSNLTTIKNALRIIKKVYDEDIDISLLPLDDKKTFELFQRGDTTGVFQFESAGMKRYLKQLKPTVFDDLIAMNALYRPGPMQWISDFIDRKQGRQKIEYLHPAMEPALRTTYGVIAYQEQVMQISKEMCGFTGGQADSLRKGIGKKIPEVLAKYKSEFIDGAIKTVGADRQLMEGLWKNLEAFASYAFPKAHSACYALIAYQTAYLKANYPEAFMAALMTSDFDDIDRLAIEISECKHMGIEVLPPDINESFVEFAVVPNSKQIRFGMSAIKNVGISAVEEILNVREDQPFDSLEAFFSVINTRSVNRKALDSLIKAGAFDKFGERGVLLKNMDIMLAFASRLQKQRASGQTDLFGNAIDTPITKVQLLLDASAVAVNQRDLLLWERELLGIYLSSHPLEPYEALLAEQTIPLSSLKPEHEGKSVTIGGAVQDIREITTKNGQKMAFVKLGDQTTELELILFPSIYQQTTGIWERDKVLLIKGKINTKDRDGTVGQDIKIMVDDAREITHEQAQAYRSTGKKKATPKASKSTKLATKAFDAPTISAEIDKRVYIRLEHSNDQDMLLSLKTTIDGR